MGFMERLRKIAAQAYIFRPEHSHLLLPGDWDFASFLRYGKAHFTNQYLGFDRL
jgi:hypothetical protein